MCGIAGIAKIKQGKDPSLDQIRRMCDTIIHRGPDEEGLDIQKSVALGMRRLSIIDLKGGSQPIFNEDRSVRTVFNGEIYNFKKLRSDLVNKGHKFNTNSDTEVIVHLYEEHGNKFPEYLNGMFAIALHDMKKNKLILTRDHIGIKPLYYLLNKNYLIWGSEIKVILASGLVEKKLNIDALAEFLSWEYVPGRGSLFKNINKLEPASFMDIDLNDGSFTIKEYWDIPEFSEMHNSFHEWQEIIDSKIRESVKMQLVSDVPLGAFLSGGVDSSLVVSSMGKAKTFSIGFEDPSYNELKWARKVADHLGVDHIDEIIKPDIVDLFDKLMYFFDDPIGDFSIFPTFLVSQLARKHVTVSLSGDGGDELFGGYETYLAERKAHLYKKIPTFFRKYILEQFINSFKPRQTKKGIINKAKRFVEGFNNPSELHHARWRLFVNDFMRDLLFTEDAKKIMQTRSGDHIIKLFKKAGNRAPLERCLYVDVKSYLSDNILTKVDRMSMAVSLEARVPYLDPSVVELAFMVPSTYKMNKNNTKVLLKSVAAKHVPIESIYRPKEGFSIPIKNWLSGKFKPLMEEMLDPIELKQEGIFNYNTIETLKKEHLNNIANHSHILWALIVFKDWQKRWLEN